MSIYKTRIIAVLLATISFLAYISAALALRQGYYVGTYRFELPVERFDIARAISNVVFQAPIDKSYSGVDQELQRKDRSLAGNINHVCSSDFQAKGIQLQSLGSSSYGLVLMYILGMRLFGVNIQAIILGFGTLLFLSVLAYVLRFNDYRFLLVPITLFSLTLMTYTPLNYAEQLPIGGIRYLALLVALPALHIILELLDVDRTNYNWLSSICLSIQTVLIGFGSVTTKHTWSVFLPLFLIPAFFAIFYLRKDTIALKFFSKKTALVLLTLLSFYVVFWLALPHSYKKFGAFGNDALWPRVFISLGANPNWPFKGIRKYECNKDYHANDDVSRMLPGILDHNLRCVWLDYATKHHFSIDELTQKLYGKEFQNAARNEFLGIASRYPQEVFITFLYYKPLLFIDNFKSIIGRYHQPVKGIDIPIALGISTAILIASLFVFCNKQNTILSIIKFSGILPVFCFAACLSYIIAWGALYNLVDLFLYLHILAVSWLSMLIGLLVIGIVTNVKHLIAHNL